MVRRRRDNLLRAEAAAAKVRIPSHLAIGNRDRQDIEEAIAIEVGSVDITRTIGRGGNHNLAGKASAGNLTEESRCEEQVDEDSVSDKRVSLHGEEEYTSFKQAAGAKRCAGRVAQVGIYARYR